MNFMPRARTSGKHPAKPSLPALARRALVLGAGKAKVIKAASIVTAAWVRLKCRYGCGAYGSPLCCPPHTPTPAEMRRVIDCYATAILFQAGRREP